MLKATLAAASLFTFSLPAAFADIRHVDESAIVRAVDKPVIRKSQEEDSPGCGATRYSFGDAVFDMKLEFKCDRINVAWTSSEESENETRSHKSLELATRAVRALTQESGAEVEKVKSGETLKGRNYANGLVVSGSCVMNSCLLTFK